MNWIRQEKRLAIYLRDGMACCWCGAKVEDGTQLTLDHLVPHCKGGSNEAINLVTACKSCNDSRGARTMEAFAKVVASYRDHGLKAVSILNHIHITTMRHLPLAQAKDLIARRGSCFAVLEKKGK